LARLNNNSTCQRQRYTTQTSFADSIVAGTLVANTNQAHNANCSTLGSRPFLSRV
jgi:hypothetical protein